MLQFAIVSLPASSGEAESIVYTFERADQWIAWRHFKRYIRKNGKPGDRFQLRTYGLLDTCAVKELR